MKRIILLLILIIFVFAFPGFSQALQMPNNIDDLAGNYDFSARSYLVLDKATGKILVSKEPELLWTPASLTKLVAVMALLDTNPKLSKIITMKKSDEVGGARLSTKAGITYSLKDLLYATLIASANNAANALVRGSGLSQSKFVEKMNQKAKDLGAKNTIFFEPSGISEKNKTTATDFAKIAKAAFENPLIASIAANPNYSFRAINNKRYVHNLKNTNKLLGDDAFGAIYGKTGYLEESMHNFAAKATDRDNNELLVVLFGSNTTASQFKETKNLFELGGLAKLFNNFKIAALGSNLLKGN